MFAEKMALQKSQGEEEDGEMSGRWGPAKPADRQVESKLSAEEISRLAA